ncbi:unnamed protein product [Prunus armeniaca]
MANLHRITIEAQFQKWWATYASVIPDDVHVKLAKPLTDDRPCVDANDPEARIITFHPFDFSLGFTFPLPKFFQKVFSAMWCAPSQCTLKVYRAIMCFKNLSRFFKLELTVQEFFYFFKVRRFEKYCQVCIYHAKLFDSSSQGDHVWHDDVLEVNKWWEGDVDDGPLVPISYCNASNICKKLELGPDMAKVGRALNISPKFHQWRWLLSEYREEVGGFPLPRMLRDGNKMVLTLMICLSDKKSVMLNPPKKGRLLSSLQDMKLLLREQELFPFAKKTQVGVVPFSSTRVKHLVGADSRNVGDMRNARDILPKPLIDKLANHDMLLEIACAQSSSPTERQRDAYIRLLSAGHLHQSKDGNRTGRSTYDPAVESQEVKSGVDSASLTPLEVRLVEAKKMRKSSARTKGSSSQLAVDPKVDKSSIVGDACVKGIDISSASKGLVFVAETIWNSSVVAPSSSQLNEQTRYEKKTYDLRAMISKLKSSIRENADISLSYDKLLARLRVHHKSAEKYKSEAIIDAYKLGYMHCADETAPFYAIEDGDIETLCPDLFPVQGEQAAEEAVAEEDGAEEDTTDKMVADVAE